MSNIPISSLPGANPLTGEETVPVVQAGTTKKTTTGNISALPFGSAAGSASGIDFITVSSASAALPSSRTLAATSPVTLTDGGAGGPLTIGLNVTPGTGTVTSVGLSGGTTGLTISNSPITTSGTMTISGTLGVPNGGSGTTTIAANRVLVGDTLGSSIASIANATAGYVLTATGAGSAPTFQAAASGVGTVTNVALSGGTTGLSVSGSPVTSSGTLTLGGFLNGTAIATASITATQVATNTISFSKIQQVAGLSVVGVTGTATANMAPITGLAGQFLAVTLGGTGLVFQNQPTQLPQGRLTLTTGTPVTTTDVTGATTVYYTPYVGRYVPIYNGTTFVNVDIGGELSNSTTASSSGNAGPTTVGASANYDEYVWLLSGGTPTLTRSPAWLSATSQGTGAGSAERIQINGIWTNKYPITNGPGTSLGTLLGSIRSNSNSQLMDSVLFRWVSNAYNDVPRSLSYQDTGGNHDYTTATIRQWNGTTSAQIDMLFTLSGNLLTATAAANSLNTGTGAFSIVSIGIDSTSANSAQMTLGPSLAVANMAFNNAAFYTGYPGMGRHFATMQEYSAASGTTTWVGGAGGLIFPGISGEITN